MRRSSRGRLDAKAAIEAVTDSPDLLLEVFGKLGCSLTLRRASQTCHAWQGARLPGKLAGSSQPHPLAAPER